MTNPRRGEIWSYRGALARGDEPDIRLVVSADAVNAAADLAVVLTVKILAADPGGLLAIPVPPHGWASAITVQPTVRSRLTERLGQVDDETIDHLDSALRAAMDL